MAKIFIFNLVVKGRVGMYNFPITDNNNYSSSKILIINRRLIYDENDRLG